MAGHWLGLTNQPGFATSTMILLTDGRVMVQEEATNHWHALSPDASGSYINGHWSQLADMAIWRRYYASGVLLDGRVVVVGGEQSGGGGDTNRGEIYDPVSDTWTPIHLPTWATVGDAAAMLLPDGRLLIGALTTPECAIYDPASNSWAPAASKAIRSNEETWILLPDETIVSAQCFPPYHAEKYVISSNVWKPEGTPPVPLVDPAMSEIGPAMLMYDGRVIYFGAADVNGFGKTALYTPPSTTYGTGVWAAGPDIPRIGKQTIVCNDCPAALLPNGKVLFAASPFVNGYWGFPVHFFEFDPATDVITRVADPPNNGSVVFMSRMMLLPTGEPMYSPSANVQCYVPDGAPRESWRPSVESVNAECEGAPAGQYLLRGRQLTGLSEANVYGDDCHPSTNYPLVRLRNPSTAAVTYCRTYGLSSRAIATGSLIQSTRFDASHVPYGRYELCVVANGISSHCIEFCHEPVRRCCCGDCDRCRSRHIDESRSQAADQELTRLHSQVRGLRESVRRFSGQQESSEEARKKRPVNKPDSPPKPKSTPARQT